MKRLLCILSSLNVGGAETYIMKIYRTIDREKYQIDFSTADKNRGFYSDEIESLGGKIHYVYPKSKNLIKHSIELFKVIKKENYKYILNVESHSLSAVDLVIARTAGCKVLAMRGTNTAFLNKKQAFLHRTFRFLSEKVPNVMLAPSTEAGIFTFGENNVKKGKVKLLYNAIPFDKFKFNEKKREEIRRELGVENNFVIGHVGRFSDQKNHVFLIDIFTEIYKRDNNARLLLIGDGEGFDKIKQKVKDYNISNAVLFLGLRDDVPDILSAMDLFLFPSLFEGMPNVIIEAQASGLRCIISDTITPEADITGLVDYLPLALSAQQWATKVIEAKNYERKEVEHIFKGKGYTVESAADNFVKFIFG